MSESMSENGKRTDLTKFDVMENAKFDDSIDRAIEAIVDRGCKNVNQAYVALRTYYVS